jgi:hypothetical protein
MLYKEIDSIIVDTSFFGQEISQLMSTGLLRFVTGREKVNHLVGKTENGRCSHTIRTSKDYFANYTRTQQ